MLDVSGLFAGLASLEWTGDQGLATATELAAATGGAVRHDPGAGEDWASVTRGETWVGIVHLHRPFAVIDPGEPVPPRPADPLVVLSVPLKLVCLRATPEAIDAAFRHGGRSPAVAAAFSAADLWFATV